LIGIIIVAHGGLAGEYLAAIEHVVGRQPGVRAVAIAADHDRSEKESEICAAADAVDTGDGVVIVTDLFGGSPSNLSLRAGTAENRRILYGVNLPALIKLAKSRQQPIGDAVRCSVEAGKKYITAQNLRHGPGGISN
jgi:mannose PTS system EIIA component